MLKIHLEQNSQLLIDKRVNTGLKDINDPKAFIKCSNNMDDIFENIEEYNTNEKQKILIVFGDMIAYVLSNKKLVQ